MVEVTQLARRGLYSIGVHRSSVDHLVGSLARCSRSIEWGRARCSQRVKLVLGRPPGRSRVDIGSVGIEAGMKLQSRGVARATERIEVVGGSLCAVARVAAVVDLLAQD